MQLVALNIQSNFSINLGEVKSYEFKNVEQAVDFLNTAELKDVFITSDSLTLFDPLPSTDEDDE